MVFGGSENDQTWQQAVPLLELQVDPDKLEGYENALGPGGIGTFVVHSVLGPEQIAFFQEEIFDPLHVAWRDNHRRSSHPRHNELVENHLVYALRTQRGDMSYLHRVPRMHALAYNIQQLIRSLSYTFPSLAEWEVDEMSMHRYDDPQVGLSYHKDNARFTGLIGVLTVEGESDVVFLDEDGKEHAYHVSEGDLSLTRANQLYPHPERDEDGTLINICPDHKVVNMLSAFRTSFIVRDNSVPQKAANAFSYENWDESYED